MSRKLLKVVSFDGRRVLSTEYQVLRGPDNLNDLFYTEALLNGLRLGAKDSYNRMLVRSIGAKTSVRVVSLNNLNLGVRLSLIDRPAGLRADGWKVSTSQNGVTLLKREETHSLAYLLDNSILGGVWVTKFLPVVGIKEE